MHLFSNIIAITMLGAFVTAGPAPANIESPVKEQLATREELADHVADVNIYSGGSCGGSAFSFNVAGAGTTRCQPHGGNSIEVTARYDDDISMCS